MLKNFWYVAEESVNVSQDRPVKARLLGQDFVLFRDRSGRANCLSDVCIHRGASLSGGKVVGSCVECPYHGWQFDHRGDCVRVPAHDGGPVPKKARVDAYPTEERYGWVWVFLGDLPESERPPIPEFPEYTSREFRFIRGEFRWNASAARVVENGLDFAHAAFVHDGAFGDRNEPHIGDYEVVEHVFGADASLSLRPPAPKGIWSILRRKRAPTPARPGFNLSGNVTHLRVDLTARWTQILFDANTPIDENTTLTRWIQGRNFFKSPLFDKDARRRVLMIFEQDARVLSEIQPEELPYDLTEEVSVKSDGLPIAYRKMRQKFINLGYQIDAHAIAENYRGRRAVVIPSPRRRDPYDTVKWVLDEVPTVTSPRRRRGLPLAPEGPGK
jgi:phenylpropionate dioxygenase-like ring-hydroxylating dioxygenase large terminal subunit